MLFSSKRCLIYSSLTLSPPSIFFLDSPLGTGVDTNIWHDNWLPRDYKLRPICARTQNPPMLASELIDGAIKTCDRQVLEEHFIEPDIDVITNIPLSSRVQSNFWAWHYDKRGIFSV